MVRGYTTIEQSRKLAEILPLESADMHYARAYFEGNESDWFIGLGKPIKSDDIIPCWSLSALLSVMICPNLEEYIKGKWDLTTFTDESLKTSIEIQDYENPIDVCVEMILKLNELKML